MTCRGFFVLRQLFLHTLKEVLRHDGGNPVRNDHVAVLKFADVATIMEHMPHAVERHFLPACVGKPLLVQPVHNGGNGLARIVAFEGFQYERRSQRVNLKMLFRVDHIADWQRAAVEFALERIVRHAPNDFFRKVSRIILGITLQYGFKDDTLCAFGDDFGR